MITPSAITEWTDFPIPGGTAPVPIAQLQSDPSTRAQSLFVRFPAGWSRPVSGFYEAAEELVVISGVLHMSGVTYRPGDWGYVPAGCVRDSTDAPDECLVFARFFGPARWREAAASPDAPPALNGTLAGESRVLRDSDGSVARYGRVRAGAVTMADTEVFDPANAAYAFVAAGSPMPSIDGPCFVRILGGET